MRRTSLLLPEEMRLEEWRRIGKKIFVLTDSSAWWLGDWLVYGQRKYPDRYRRAIDETALNYQTLCNYAWVAGRFPPPRRRAGLSFQHHAEVAALPEAEQDDWLDKAERLSWSRNQLRRQIRAVRSVPPEQHKTKAVSILVNIAPVRMLRWQEAATRSRKDLLEWITAILDEAATRERLMRASDMDREHSQDPE